MLRPGPSRTATRLRNPQALDPHRPVAAVAGQRDEFVLGELVEEVLPAGVVHRRPLQVRQFQAVVGTGDGRGGVRVDPEFVVGLEQPVGRAQVVPVGGRREGLLGVGPREVGQVAPGVVEPVGHLGSGGGVGVDDDPFGLVVGGAVHGVVHVAGQPDLVPALVQDPRLGVAVVVGGHRRGVEGDGHGLRLARLERVGLGVAAENGRRLLDPVGVVGGVVVHLHDLPAGRVAGVGDVDPRGHGLLVGLELGVGPRELRVGQAVPERVLHDVVVLRLGHEGLEVAVPGVDAFEVVGQLPVGGTTGLRVGAHLVGGRPPASSPLRVRGRGG